MATRRKTTQEAGRSEPLRIRWAAERIARSKTRILEATSKLGALNPGWIELSRAALHADTVNRNAVAIETATEDLEHRQAAASKERSSAQARTPVSANGEVDAAKTLTKAAKRLERVFGRITGEPAWIEIARVEVTTDVVESSAEGLKKAADDLERRVAVELRRKTAPETREAADARRRRIVELARKGTPATDIAADVGVSARTVYKHLKKAGVPNPSTRREGAAAKAADPRTERPEKTAPAPAPVAERADPRGGAVRGGAPAGPAEKTAARPQSRTTAKTARTATPERGEGRATKPRRPTRTPSGPTRTSDRPPAPPARTARVAARAAPEPVRQAPSAGGKPAKPSAAAATKGKAKKRSRAAAGTPAARRRTAAAETGSGTGSRAPRRGASAESRVPAETEAVHAATGENQPNAGVCFECGRGPERVYRDPDNDREYCIRCLHQEHEERVGYVSRGHDPARRA